MANVIHVLTQMGSNANCQSEEAINSLLDSTELESDVIEAIINKDITYLERQLGTCPDIICAVAPAEDDDDDKDKEDDKDSTEETSNRVVGFK